MIFNSNLHQVSSEEVKILRPLIRSRLKNGISYKTFTEFIKWLFIDIAAKEFRIDGRKQSDSRISVITGLSRKEVKRIREILQSERSATEENYNRAIRVIYGWLSESDLKKNKKIKKEIPVYGNGFTFDTLVRRYSGDVPTRAVLDELVRIGAIKKISNNRVRLVTS
jgi:hypothetical protein